MDPSIKIKEGVKPHGKITIRSHPAGSVERFKKMIAEAGNDLIKRACVMAEIRAGKILAVQDNTIMKGANTGKDLIIQWLLGLATYPIGINWGAIGTSTTPPAESDTQLVAEYARSTVSFSEDAGYNEAIVQFFFTDSMLSNQSYYEFGTFINGTAGINTGQIFNRALFSSPVVKTSGTDLTVECDFTLT